MSAKDEAEISRNKPELLTRQVWLGRRASVVGMTKRTSLTCRESRHFSAAFRLAPFFLASSSFHNSFFPFREFELSDESRFHTGATAKLVDTCLVV